MNLLHIDQFNIIGITVKTSNKDVIKLQTDMQNLWNRFIAENIKDKIPHKIDDNIYCVYTDYEGDHTMPYVALLGYRVNSLEVIPTGLTAKSFNQGIYNKYTAKGNLFHGIVFEKWQSIWQLNNVKRTYIADFEIYGTKAQNPENAEVDIFIGVSN